MIWWQKLRAAAGPNPDPKDDDSETEATLISIPTIPKVWYPFCVSIHRLKLLKYRDPLHIMLEYIAEVSRGQKTRYFLVPLVLICNV
jgi:hypothetical protein